jgi:hypothetical protein
MEQFPAGGYFSRDWRGQVSLNYPCVLPSVNDDDGTLAGGLRKPQVASAVLIVGGNDFV